MRGTENQKRDRRQEEGAISLEVARGCCGRSTLTWGRYYEPAKASASRVGNDEGMNSHTEEGRKCMPMKTTWRR
jgi:hypothetical protein